MRSDSRLFLENPEQFKRDVVDAGTPPEVAQESIRQGGTTLVQPVATEATRQAQRGQSGTIVEDDYLGHETLQAYAPVDLPGLELVDHRQDRHLRGVRPGLGIHADARVVNGRHHLRGLSRRDAAGPPVRPADPKAGSRSSADQCRGLRHHPARAVTRRIRRSDSGVQRHEPQPRYQGGTAHRAAPRERPADAVAHARTGGAALPRGRGDDLAGPPGRHGHLRRHRRPRRPVLRPQLRRARWRSSTS